MKKFLVAGNWKMNNSPIGAKKLCWDITQNYKSIDPNVKVLICPPFTSFCEVRSIITSSGLAMGGQNCHFEEKGAFTGEISAQMLAEAGCTYVIIGHSERRKYFTEDDGLVNLKVKSALAAGLNVILCIGETLDERREGATYEVLARQLDRGLEGIAAGGEKSITIAYEPVWAIGTGIAATVAQIDEAHNFLRDKLSGLFPGAHSQILIQYGGSVDAGNARSIFAIPEVSGALIGGASLRVESFIEIIKSAEALSAV